MTDPWTSLFICFMWAVAIAYACKPIVPFTYGMIFSLLGMAVGNGLFRLLMHMYGGYLAK